MMTAPTQTHPAPYLTGLNPPQLQAVETLDGSVLILAGAGTGKTRALTTRLAHLLHTGHTTPERILAVTFTNKAAREMKERVSNLLGGYNVDGWWLGTFHSLSARMLRNHAELVGLKPHFTIINDDDQIKLIKQCFEIHNIDPKAIKPRLVQGVINGWKDLALPPEKVTSSDAPSSFQRHDAAIGGDMLLRLYRTYQERLKVLNCCDFGDLLMHMIVIFHDTSNGILAQYHDQFTHMMVDEYQDTNGAQYQWLRLLAQKRHNLCCVGDDDQSIYSWRGAQVKNIRQFDRDFPNATIIRLEQNYRSTGHILAAANALIDHNDDRYGKTLWTDAGDGNKVLLKHCDDDRDEARTISEKIESLIDLGTNPNEIAILVRTSSQMRGFEERFNDIGLPYRVVGGPRFYERLEIRDALAYLRMLVQPDDDLALERAMGTPKRGIGKSTVQKLHNVGRARGMSLYGVMSSPTMLHETLSSRPLKLVSTFAQQIEIWRQKLAATPPADMLGIVLDESGYTQMWQEDTEPSSQARLENLKELVNAVSDFPTLAAFLEHIALVMERQTSDEAAMTTLMTLHAAKGLEFDHVFLPGWEEGLFPNQRALDDTGRAAEEEERRLAYVGLTRARHRAMISYARARKLYGQWQNARVSRFVRELPHKHCDGDFPRDDSAYMGLPQQNNYGFGHQPWQQKALQSRAQSWQKSFSHKKSADPRNPTRKNTSSLSRENDSPFHTGQRVSHSKFGAGRIIRIDDDKADVAFENAGVKRLMHSFLNPQN